MKSGHELSEQPHEHDAERAARAPAPVVEQPRAKERRERETSDGLGDADVASPALSKKSLPGTE